MQPYNYFLLTIFIYLNATFLQADETLGRETILKVMPKLEEVILKGMKTSHVPGAAVGIVFQDEVVYLKGFGVKKEGFHDPVTPDTVFQLASVSKPITSSILARLVSEGKIDWDDKIENLNPEFRLSDPWISSQLTLKDLLSHRSGLPDHAGDLLEDLGYARNTILHQLRYIKQLNSFRADFAYTNFGFSEAAYAAARVLNTDWDHLAKHTLFDPLEMGSTSTTLKDYLNSKDHATTHIIKDNHTIPLEIPRNPDAQSPAGGINSSVRDMAKWLILELGGYQEKKLISEEAILATQTPLIVNGKDFISNRPTFYGMGWGISYSTNGKMYLRHSGGFTLGTRTQAALSPDDKLGIIILTNSSIHGLPEAVSQTFFDLVYSGAPQRDWVAFSNEMWEKMTDKPKKYQPKAFPSLPLERYVGAFHNDYYGNIQIYIKNDELFLRIGPKNLEFPLLHLSGDVFSFESTGESAIGEAQVIFTMNEAQKVHSITIDYLNPFGEGTFLPQAS